jgi:hypothetical protein
LKAQSLKLLCGFHKKEFYLSIFALFVSCIEAQRKAAAKKKLIIKHEVENKHNPAVAIEY